jgi:hypothetical protein
MMHAFEQPSHGMQFAIPDNSYYAQGQSIRSDVGHGRL